MFFRASFLLVVVFLKALKIPKFRKMVSFSPAAVEDLGDLRANNGAQILGHAEAAATVADAMLAEQAVRRPRTATRVTPVRRSPRGTSRRRVSAAAQQEDDERVDNAAPNGEEEPRHEDGEGRSRQGERPIRRGREPASGARGGERPAATERWNDAARETGRVGARGGAR